MRKFKIVTNTTKDSNWNFTKIVCRFLVEHDASYVVEAGKLEDRTPGRPDDRIMNPDEDFEPEAVIVLGGDGTVLQAAERDDGKEIPILGINLGTIGYLAEIDRDNWQEALMQLFNGCYYLEERMMLEGCLAVRHPVQQKEDAAPTLNVANAWDPEEVKKALKEAEEKRDQTASNGSNLSDLTSAGYEVQASTAPSESEPDYNLYHALNDVVIARVGALRVINYDVYVNGRFLNSYNADGIIVSTPTGSTGYNLSAGGPIVEPSAEMIVLTPICPHQINVRSIVLSARDVITIRIGSTSRSRVLEAEADFDGGGRVTLSTGDAVSIRRSDQVTRLIKFENRSFLEILHQKMNQ